MTREVAILIFGAVLLNSGIAEAQSTFNYQLSGNNCQPDGNPTVNWTNLSYTGYGPGNFGTSTRTLMCPIQMNLVNWTTGSSPNTYFNAYVYDRSPNDEVKFIACNYTKDGNGASGCTQVGSGVGATGGYAFTNYINNRTSSPDQQISMLWITLPAVYNGNVSHITSYGVAQ